APPHALDLLLADGREIPRVRRNPLPPARHRRRALRRRVGARRRGAPAPRAPRRRDDALALRDPDLRLVPRRGARERGAARGVGAAQLRRRVGRRGDPARDRRRHGDAGGALRRDPDRGGDDPQRRLGRSRRRLRLRVVAARAPPLHRLGGSDARLAFRGAALRRLCGAPAARGADRADGRAVRRRRALLALGAALFALACRSGAPAQAPEGAGTARGAPPPGPGPGPTDAQLRDADADPGEWLIYGRTYAETRYSPLDQIDETNVGRLGLAWTTPTGTTRGM